MMKKILILSLENCQKCLQYKDLFTNYNILYEEINCSSQKNNSACNKFENISSCDMYPMTIVNSQYIIALSTDYEKIGKIITNEYHIIYAYSINNMFDIANKLLLL